MGGPVGGRDDSGLTSQFEVPKCTRASDEMYQWDLKSCRCICGPDSAQPDVNAKCRGEELVEAGVLPGQWVLVEAYSDEEDELWLGKTVACFEGGGCMKEVEERCTIDGTRYDAGNYRIGVQWYERVVEDGGSRLVCASGRQTTLGASGCFGGSSQALRRFCDATHPLTPGSVVLCNTSSVVSRKKETSSFIIITFSSLPRFHISFFILLRQHFDSRTSCFMPSEVTPICALLEHKSIA